MYCSVALSSDLRCTLESIAILEPFVLHDTLHSVALDATTMTHEDL
jgi:hypothetical protein